MRKMLLATAIACSPIFAQASLGQLELPTYPPDRSSAQAALQDGAWNVVYAEIEGRKVETTDIPTVKISNNTLTFRHGGKECTMRLQLQPEGRIRATDVVLRQSAGLREDPERKTDQNQEGLIGQTQEQEQAASKDGEKGSFEGVYIKTSEFLCVSLKSPKEQVAAAALGYLDQTNAKSSVKDRGQDDGAGAVNAQDNKMVLILRRAN